MTEVIMFHHALGATDGVVAFADQLRDGGHRVTGADLFGARRSTRSRRASRMRGKLGWDEMSAPSRSSTAWGSARTHEIGPREGSPGCPSVRECLLSPSLFGGLTRQVGAEFGVASGWGELRGRVTERRRTDSLAWIALSLTIGRSTMTGGPGAKDAPHTLNDEERAPEKDVLLVSGSGNVAKYWRG